MDTVLRRLNASAVSVCVFNCPLGSASYSGSVSSAFHLLGNDSRGGVRELHQGRLLTCGVLRADWSESVDREIEDASGSSSEVYMNVVISIVTAVRCSV